MRRLLKMDLRKAIANPYFIVALGIGLFLCCAEAVEVMGRDSFFQYLDEMAAGEGDVFISPASYSCFISWMSVGGDLPWLLSDGLLLQSGVVGTWARFTHARAAGSILWRRPWRPSPLGARW